MFSQATAPPNFLPNTLLEASTADGWCGPDGRRNRSVGCRKFLQKKGKAGKGKAGASWGGISSSLRSCHAAHSPKFLSPLLLFSTHPDSFSSSETQGQIVGTRKILNGREKWREEGSPRMFLFSPAM